MPTTIQFRTDERTDKAIEYLIDELGVDSKSKSVRWCKLLVLLREYVVKAELENVNYQRPETLDTDEGKTPLPVCNVPDVSDTSGKWYCDGKLKDKVHCLGRYRRDQAVNLKCYPQHWAKTRTRRTREKPRRTMVKATFVQCPKPTKKTSLKHCS